jgi:hypothetical protein
VPSTSNNAVVKSRPAICTSKQLQEMSRPRPQPSRGRRSFCTIPSSAMPNALPMSLATQIVWLFVLAGPVACAAWTVTHEELFAELHAGVCGKAANDEASLRASSSTSSPARYCLSHYVAAVAIALTGFPVARWRMAGAVVCVARRCLGGQCLHEPVRSAAARHQT